MNRQKRWYDYLWVASLLYLILGFFNILFAWLGLLCFAIPLIMAAAGKDKGYCNRYCGRGQLFALLGGKWKLSRRLPIPHWLKSIWFSNLLHGHVSQYALHHLAGVCRSRGAKAGGHTAVDLQAALALGLSGSGHSLDRAVCLWFLQRYVYLHSAGPGHHVPVPPPNLVCLLSDGYHDTDDLHGQARKKGIVFSLCKNEKMDII